MVSYLCRQDHFLLTEQAVCPELFTEEAEWPVVLPLVGEVLQFLAAVLKAGVRGHSQAVGAVQLPGSASR